jgi:hypothetical protein
MTVSTLPVKAGATADRAAPRTVARLFRPQNTPERLRTFRAALFAAVALLGVIALVGLEGVHSNAVSIRGGAAPAYVDVIQATAVLSDADRAVWQSLRSGEAQFTGPGQQYQGDVTTAEQDLQQVAALEPRDSASSKLLQTLTGQLVTYQGLVEQADAADRADTALGPASSHDLGYAYLGYAGQALSGQGGLLPTMSTLAQLNQKTLNGRSRSLWTDPVLFALYAMTAVVMLGLVVAAQLFLRRRFRRTISPPLLLAAALVCGLLAWMASVILSADAAVASARNAALPHVVAIWQDQTQAVDTQARLLQAGRGANAAVSGGGLSLTAAQPASAAFDADLVSAETTGGLLIGIPITAVVIAGLILIAIKPRLDEYRG